MDFRIAMTVSDRPQYLAETLKYWQNVHGLDKYPLVFHVESTPQTKNNLEVIESFTRDSKALTDVVINPGRFGVLVNPWQAFERAFNSGADFVLLVEEDTPVSTDVLEYFTWAADQFAEDDSVLGVCARSDPAPSNVSESGCVLTSDFAPVVWGTWKRSWYESIRDTWDKDYSTGSGDSRGFDHNLRLRIMGDRTFVFPLASRSTHIGVFGIHMRPENFKESEARSFVADRPSGIEYTLVDGVLPILR